MTAEEKLVNLEKLFKQWCQETERSGGILVGKSVREFFEWLRKYPNFD